MKNPDPSKTSLKTIALFPLPTSVFYPGTVLPLHIFEERYRQMTANAIEAGRWIGMVLLQPGYEEEYYGSPEINLIGCAGSLEQWTQHDDGKYDIVLRGQSRFRIVREVGDTPYRQAEVELLTGIHDQPADPAADLYKQLIGKFHSFTSQLPLDNAQKVEMDALDCKTLGEVVDRVAYFFDQPLQDRQKFLEELDVLKRYHMVSKLIDLKLRIVQQSALFSKKGINSRLN
ncbi:MAG: LON peptidase substrate-binding domain-containing protein [Nitrospinae bacterium]|nr:LON peptidase substrate-binding domain-containing protein [Nitrospinota bacterium]